MHDLSETTLNELRALAKQHGLPISGNKQTLINRLAAAELHDEDDVFASDDPDLAPETMNDDDVAAPVEADGAVPEPDGFRARVIALLGTEDADTLSDGEALEALSNRLTPGRIITGTTPPQAPTPQDYQRVYSEAIEDAIKEYAATVGRTGGTYVHRLRRLAERA